MLADTLLYVGFLICFCLSGWGLQTAWLFFPILLAIFICITLSVLCAALSHLVQKASEMQEEQDLTI